MSGLSDRAQLRLRWGIAVLLGIAAGAIAGPALGLAAGLLAGWGALACVSTIWVLLQVWPMDADATRAHATAEDPSRRIARLIAIAGSVVSLAAVVIVMIQARHASGAATYWLAGIAVVSIVASWALIQINYLLHFARSYYEDRGDGEIKRGIDFNQQEPPEYTDFAYFSIGLGMTYQVADTNVTRNEIRRIVIAQTTLAYLFGAGILATVINLVSGLG
ncbi:DUF1345 domain-containing protein [Leucobacter iarius]|uniref:DUF1345 domain-containing protein n=1 Tax=Leucobacter iarius TaxID=333963 RepID=A0ABN2LS24_9MICO